MIVNASVELALIVVLRANPLALELPTFVETVDGIEGAEDGLEVDIDDPVGIVLVELDVLDRAELSYCKLNENNFRVRGETHLGTKCLAHLLPHASIIALSIGRPIDPPNAAPSNNDS